MWDDFVMILLELLAAVCAVAVCGPCFLACARRILLGDELISRQSLKVREAEVIGCDEPACPYYKKNVKYLLVPAERKQRVKPHSSPRF